MIISLVSVGKHYNQKLEEALDFFKDYDVCLLSDIESNNVYYFEKYEQETFSYFDKLYFTLKLVDKFKRDVFYVDITKISEVNLNFSKDTIFYFKSYWPFGDFFEDYLQYDFFKPLINKWNDTMVDYKKLPAIRETELFFNKELDTIKITKHLKDIQPLFREMSINNPTYPCYDNAEGIALSYALRKCSIL